MKNIRSNSDHTHSSAFTLIEMIGVLAVMAILATVLVPNVVHSLDRVAVVAEEQTLRNLGGQVIKYLQDNGVPPGVGTWTTDTGTYSSISQLDILTNRRQMNRVYLLDPDPAFPQQRAIILSSMRQGMTLPTSATTLQFDALWKTVDGQVPSAASWSGWTAMAADYLVIERVNFKSEYRAINLVNIGASSTPPVSIAVHYEVVSSKGALLYQGQVGYATGANKVNLPNLVANERVNLYVGATNATAIDYSYIVNTSPKTFDFNGAHWRPE